MSTLPAARLRAGGLSFVLVGLLLAGCTPLQSEQVLANSAMWPGPVELTTVPFYPQEAYQCGPAALATTLNATGLSLTPEALAPQVFLPGRQGSLQVEMMAATRRHGRVPYVLRPRLEALLAEVGAGNPVLVLQNLGLSWYPKWHYAVVVGVDAQRGELILRSGREPRHTVSFEVFERTWRRADYWALVTLPPDRLPATATERRFLEAVIPFERLRNWPPAETGYRTALDRWPGSLAATIGLGNARFGQGDIAGAAAVFAQATRDHPGAATAYNNLAETLAALGRWDAAVAAAEQAVALGQGPFLDYYRETLSGITRRRACAQAPAVGCDTVDGSPPNNSTQRREGAEKTKGE